MRFEAGVNINATPETIWDAVADPEKWPQWTDAIHKVKKLSEGPLGVGSRLRITIIAIIPIRLLMTITEFVPGQLVVMEGKALVAKMTRYYRLEAQDGHTKAVAGGVASGPMAPLVWLVGQVMSEQIVQALKVRIEDSSSRQG